MSALSFYYIFSVFIQETSEEFDRNSKGKLQETIREGKEWTGHTTTSRTLVKGKTQGGGNFSNGHLIGSI